MTNSIKHRGNLQRSHCDCENWLNPVEDSPAMREEDIEDALANEHEWAVQEQNS